jgi:hypothetical protein
VDDVCSTPCTIEQAPAAPAPTAALAEEIRVWRRKRAKSANPLKADKRLAALYLDLCRSADAASHLKSLVSAVPSDFGAWRDLARCLKLSGQPEQELEAWRGLLQLTPDDPEALGRLAALEPQGVSLEAAPDEDGLAHAARLQRHGAFAGAAAVYASMRPHIRDTLRQFRPDGRHVHGPDFLIIGASRTGTSWLVRALARHPQIFILSGEPHYFSAWAEEPPQAYVRRFAEAGAQFVGKPESAWPLVQGAAVFGEKSPLYLTMPDDRVALCATLFPKARLICLVRDPIERAWSHLRQIGLEHRAEDIAFLKSSNAPVRLAQVIEEGRYRHHLRRWARWVSPDRMLLLDHGRIVLDPDAVYDETIAWLGLERRRPRKANSPQVHVSTSEPPPPRLRAFLEASYDGEPFDVPALQRATIKAHKAAVRGAAAAPEA